MSESEVIVSYDGPLQIIKINRPEKKNALTLQCYGLIRDALKRAAEDETIKVTLVTGVGDYFSSGNDFSGSGPTASEDMDVVIRNSLNHMREFIRVLIDHPKIIIGLINGPAVGIAVTMLGLFDIIYALNTATFSTPFSSLGIVAEGCSTYTFPQCMGRSLAAKMLYFNYKMSAKEAKDCGFVADIVTQNEVPALMAEIKKMSELPLKSLMYSKQMVRGHHLKSLHYANTVELEKIAELFKSEDFLNALMTKFMMKKKNKL